MGEVYRARDTRLDRDVALKILPAGMASDPARLERFEREAKTVAGLNHPNIVTLHSVEEHDGVRFITMELVEGQGLDDLITSDGLPLAKVFEVGVAVSGALAVAHEKGIVHRDLKPANVMITKDGHAKVLDFGLAKLTETSASSEQAATQVSPLTTEGAIMGTVPYMSPEQLRGGAVDHRSDIFSLGVMLYEMTTGQRPFLGASNSDITSAILRDTPTPITQVKPGIPVHLGRIIAHCLEKDPEQRIQSAKDARNELRSLQKEVESGSSEMSTGSVAAASRASTHRGRLIGVAAAAAVLLVAAVLFFGRNRVPQSTHEQAPTAATSEVDPHSIAVLPFVDLSTDKNQEYFSDGISEELLNLLAKVPQLKVMARTSSFSFKGKQLGVPEIAKQLHVANVLEGSVQRNGDQLRITTQLVHAEDGFQVWSGNYDRKLDDIFKIQDEIAAEVVKELQVTLLGAAPKAREANPQAYALYLQATALELANSAEGFAKSDSLLRKALEIDPSYSPAWAGLSMNFINRQALGVLSGELRYARAREAAEKAITLDPDNAPAHALLGYIAESLNDIPGAAKHYEKALALDPNNTRVILNAVSLLRGLGREDEALALLESVRPRDPLNAPLLNVLGSVQTGQGRLDDAIATLHTLLDLSPGRGRAHYGLCLALLLKGDAAGALAGIEKETGDAFRMIGLPMAYHAAGRNAESDAALDTLIANLEKDAPYNIAYVYAFRGETDNAFKWLEKARSEEDPGLAEIVFERMFDNIRSDPRWLPFLRKIGKAPEQLARIPFNVTLPKT